MACSRDADPRKAALISLRRQIARLERGSAFAECTALSLAPGIDAHLTDGGLARGALHDVLAADPGAAAGLCARMLARTEGTVFWISPEPDAAPQGLAALGIDPSRLVLVRVAHSAAGLWAMEEVLRCPAVTGAVLVGPDLDLASGRRLQLAAEAGGGIGLLLRPDTEASGPTAARSRWRVAACPASERDVAWRLWLLRSRGGRPGEWRVQWNTAESVLQVQDEVVTGLPRRWA